MDTAPARHPRGPAGRQLLDLAAQFGERLGEDRLAVRVAAPLPHIGEVGLVRLGARRVRGVVPVLAGRKAAARAVPGVGNLRVAGEARLRLVPVGAPEGDAQPRCGLAALGLAHRPRPDPASSDRVATCHGRNSLRDGAAKRVGVPLRRERLSLRKAQRASSDWSYRPPHPDASPMIGRAWERVTEHGAQRTECVGRAARDQLFVFIRMPRTTMHASHSTPITTVIRSRLRSATEEPPTEDCMPPPNMSERPPPFPLCISTSSISSRLKTIRAIENPKTTAGPTSSESDGRRGHGTRAVPPQEYDVSRLPPTHERRHRTVTDRENARS
ncbi:hypothetical protein SGPA1_31438 [Streptomyces misionensis JCM 4497]